MILAANDKRQSAQDLSLVGEGRLPRLLLLCNRTAGGIRYAESYLEDNRKYINRDVLQLLNDLTSCKPSGLRICA